MNDPGPMESLDMWPDVHFFHGIDGGVRLLVRVPDDRPPADLSAHDTEAGRIFENICKMADGYNSFAGKSATWPFHAEMDKTDFVRLICELLSMESRFAENSLIGAISCISEVREAELRGGQRIPVADIEMTRHEADHFTLSVNLTCSRNERADGLRRETRSLIRSRLGTTIDYAAALSMAMSATSVFLADERELNRLLIALRRIRDETEGPASKIAERLLQVADCPPPPGTDGILDAQYWRAVTRRFRPAKAAALVDYARRECPTTWNELSGAFRTLFAGALSDLMDDVTSSNFAAPHEKLEREALRITEEDDVIVCVD